MRTILVLLAFGFSWWPAAHAWNATGHQMTADIAFQQLDTEWQARIHGVLKAHPRYRQDFAAAMPNEIRRGTSSEQARWLFRRASIWPDLVPNISESVRAQYHRGTWHYINLPAYLTPQDETDMQDRLDHNMSSRFTPPLRQRLNVIQALEGNLRVWQDTDASDADKAVALCWILHLVGDMHQPLHTVALFSREFFPEGDRGGNSIRIQAKPKPTNLHAVWDGLPDGFADLQPSAATQQMLAGERISNELPAVWVKRHFRLAQEFAYTPSLKTDLAAVLENDPNAAISLSPAYRTAAGAVAREQVIAAGYRIAGLLER